MTRVAAVDCGTNTIRLLVADIHADSGAQDSLVREQRIVRLGQGVDSSGRLADEELAAAFGDGDPAVRRRAASIAAQHPAVSLRSLLDDADPAVVERMGTFSATIVASTPEALAEHVRAEMVKWEPVVRDANVSLD